MSDSTSAGKASDRTRTTGAGVAPPADGPDAVRADIEQTRAALGDSVQELAGRADVKARTKGKVAEVKDQAAQVKDRAKDTAEAAAVRAEETAQQAAARVRQRPAPYAGVVAGLATAAGAIVLVRRRRRRAAKARARRWWRW
jgi:hypothetical protein